MCVIYICLFIQNLLRLFCRCECGNEQDFEAALSIDRTTFFKILKLFPRYKGPKKRQYERRFSPMDNLAISLMFMASTMSQKYMCFIFGGNECMISRALKNGLLCLRSALSRMPAAKVRFPSKPEELNRYSRLLLDREPRLPPGAVGLMDGLNLPVQTKGNLVEAEVYFNGWLQGYFVSNVFLWSPEGKIIFSCVNYPGDSSH